MSSACGSRWRKWDLHIHVPNTKLNNQYDKSAVGVDVDRFCHALNRSDVHAFGLTDYFSLDGYFEVVNRYRELENTGNLDADREVLFIPNLELRLPNTANNKGELVDYHLLFNPSLTQDLANRFLSSLKTSLRDAQGRDIPCSELSGDEFSQATVDLSAIEGAVRDTFGREVDRADYLLAIVPVNGNGIRAASGNQRKRTWSDNIERSTDGLFGNKSNTQHFLRTDRYDLEIPSVPKPVFAGSDAHSFSDLEAWLGKEVSGNGSDKNITWIKSDLTYEGLRQAFIEPAGRVRIQRNQPDFKEPRQVIESVHFSDTPHFPPEIKFNPNLNSIIGTRSSGKSSLLAHISYAVDPEYTKLQQISAGHDHKQLGPAAGHYWESLGDLKCTVRWGDKDTATGKVVYVPQNSLFSISARPDEIAAKIRPVIRRISPELDGAFKILSQDLDRINHEIKDQVTAWFKLDQQKRSVLAALANLGDRQSIERSLQDLADTVDQLRASCQLTDEEVESYTKAVGEISRLRDERDGLERDIAAIRHFLKTNQDTSTSLVPEFDVLISTTPQIEVLPADLARRASVLMSESASRIKTDISNLAIARFGELSSRSIEFEELITRLQSDNSEIFRRYEKLDELKEPEVRIEALRRELAEFDKCAANSEQLDRDLGEITEKILSLVNERADKLDKFVTAFDDANISWDGIEFGAQVGIDIERLSNISGQFNKRSDGLFVERRSDLVKIESIRKDPARFLCALAEGEQQLNRGADPEQASCAALSLTEEIRLTAELDGDRIGGFEASSMTPGKQALFALRLILGESDERWPLLLDQPEDDLDSRSIFDVIVSDLIKKKSERQIIIVTHDANLVVGADSEAVIVANRHGADRPNKDSRTFDYITGALENTNRLPHHPTTLGRLGIREHACEVLDGGEQAFQKRRDKYRI